MGFVGAIAIAPALGLIDGWATAWSIFAAIGAAAGAYAGVCSPFLGQENCPLLHETV